jgi:cell wall-associated NlpC family hydrolase
MRARWIGSLVIALLVLVRTPIIYAQKTLDISATLVKNIPGLEGPERGRLSLALSLAFADVATLSDTLKVSVNRTINTGLFEMSANTGDADDPMSDADFAQIAQAARVAHDAILAGAKPDRVADLILVAFARPVSGGQVAAAANALDRLIEGQVSEAIAREVIAQALDAKWSSQVLGSVVGGLVLGIQQGLDAENLALSLVIGVAQQSSDTAIETVVSDALNAVRLGQDATFDAVRNAQSAGLPESLGREIYFVAVEEGWSQVVLQGVLDGLLKGQQLGLPLEKLATALIVRVSMGLDGQPIAQIVAEEMRYVQDLTKTQMAQIQQALKPSLQSAPGEAVADRKLGLRLISTVSMAASVQDFIGTPYRWGGTARRRGVDCSGFTQGVYRDLRIVIPRVSRDQFRRAPIKVSKSEKLQYGDLVFFNKYGGADQYITHVGLYLGADEKGIVRFAHASSSKGVTISRFDKRYYRSRYVGGGRVAQLQKDNGGMP